MTAREPMAAYAPASQGIRDFCEELVSQHQLQRNKPDSADQIAAKYRSVVGLYGSFKRSIAWAKGQSPVV
jgi:hypothetical protein